LIPMKVNFLGGISKAARNLLDKIKKKRGREGTQAQGRGGGAPDSNKIYKALVPNAERGSEITRRKKNSPKKRERGEFPRQKSKQNPLNRAIWGKKFTRGGPNGRRKIEREKEGEKKGSERWGGKQTSGLPRKKKQLYILRSTSEIVPVFQTQGERKSGASMEGGKTVPPLKKSFGACSNIPGGRGPGSLLRNLRERRRRGSGAI